MSKRVQVRTVREGALHIGGAMLAALVLTVAAEGVGIEASPSSASEPKPGWTLVWQDEFDGEAIDPAKWSHEVSGGGFGNNELQFYTDRPANSFLRDGTLVIRALREAHEDHGYTSAKLITKDKASWTYGRYEIRARLPAGQGIWPAFWMMPSHETRYGEWPAGGEIDIVELVGNRPGEVYGTLHFGNPWKNIGGHAALPGEERFADAFHTFAMEWMPGKFEWFVDEVPFYTATNWYTSADDAMWPAPFDRDFFLQLNLAVGGNWPGFPDESTPFPAELAVDFVRVYALDGEYPEVETRPATAERQTPRSALPDGNLVYNGDFSEGATHWKLGLQEGGEGGLAVEDASLHIRIAHGGRQIYSVQLLHEPLNVVQGSHYELVFRAKSASPTTVQISVGKGSQHWDSYSERRSIDLRPQWAQQRFKFLMNHPTDPVARLEFNLGNQNEDIWIADVSLKRVE